MNYIIDNDIDEIQSNNNDTEGGKDKEVKKDDLKNSKTIKCDSCRSLC